MRRSRFAFARAPLFAFRNERECLKEFCRERGERRLVTFFLSFVEMGGGERRAVSIDSERELFVEDG
jgi:hypothetical protein